MYHRVPGGSKYTHAGNYEIYLVLYFLAATSAKLSSVEGAKMQIFRDIVSKLGENLKKMRERKLEPETLLAFSEKGHRPKRKRKRKKKRENKVILLFFFLLLSSSFFFPLTLHPLTADKRVVKKTKEKRRRKEKEEEQNSCC